MNQLLERDVFLFGKAFSPNRFYGEKNMKLLVAVRSAVVLLFYLLINVYSFNYIYQEASLRIFMLSIITFALITVIFVIFGIRQLLYYDKIAYEKLNAIHRKSERNEDN